ncbi:MAG: regulatory iron-sulfur-containing complex subunit RicT, partial [Saprospiraceae bacterium]
MACVGCTSCSTSKDSTAGGCKSTGGCATGGCNRHNTYDWITAMGIADPKPFDTVEVSFKNGARKEFFKNPPFSRASTGDWVLVESVSGGYDVGTVTLSGELVRLQMKRKRVRPDARLQSVVRKAHDRDLERLQEVRSQEKEVMIKARVIARTLEMNMKIGDVEFQGDGRKCTFYYTADGRVDFRELIRSYARDFKVKIEMRQIGARQESARLGGIGNCGRELCCSTWLTEFKSVNTAAARYQNLAINQTKLSGMCGRLKCCLNYELDTYIDALEDFPDRAERLKTTAGMAILVKTDVFKRLMYYTYAEHRGKFYAIHVDQIWEALEMIKQGKMPGSLEDILAMAPQPEFEETTELEPDFENVHDVIQLPMEQRKKKKKNNRKGRDRSQSAAAALENAPPPTFERGRPQGRPDDRRGQRPPNEPGDRPNRPPGDRPQNRPDNRPPRPENRGPEKTDQPSQPKPGGHPDKPNERRDRPQQDRPDNRPPRTDNRERNEQRPPAPERHDPPKSDASN